jgi:hypothetical protein
MTTTPEIDTEGTARFVTGPNCGLLPILNPRGGKRLDIYGSGKPVPQGVLSNQQIRHFLDKGLIEAVDDRGIPDRYRVVECLSAIIATDSEQGWGRPRVAERLRSQGFAYSNKTISIAVLLFNSDWKLGQPIPERG